MRRLAVEQLQDAVELVVPQAEGAVERLFDELRQEDDSSRPC